MPNFSYVALSDNFFNGTLPDGLCEGGKLQHLALNNNSVEGAIPLSLASCASLVRIRIDDNLFTSMPVMDLEGTLR
jgi:Ran GTPase-activating protein (RanGAP) involved in mRNA processing and transport